MASYRLSYYPWITQHRPPAEIHGHVQAFADALRSALGASRQVVVLPPLEVDKQIDQILAGESDIALMNPLGYVFARMRANGSSVESVAIALRKIDGIVGDTYFAQVYAHASLGLAKGDPQLATKLRNRSIAYGVPYSTSNFLVNAYSLRQMLDVHPLTHFRRTEFLGGHDIVAKAVYDGKTDIGAGHDGVIVDLANQPGYHDAAQKLIQIVRSDPLPSDPVVVRVGSDAERTELQRALVAAGQTPQGKAALEGFWGMAQGLRPIGADKYDILVQTMKALGVVERDLLAAS